MQVKVDTERLKRVEAERMLTKLQQSSTMADVFAKYEADIEQLREQHKLLLSRNEQLLRQLQALPVATTPTEDPVTRRKCDTSPGVVPSLCESEMQ